MEVGVAVVVVATAEEVVVEATGLASARPANAGTAVPLAPAGHLSAVGGATAAEPVGTEARVLPNWQAAVPQVS